MPVNRSKRELTRFAEGVIRQLHHISGEICQISNAVTLNTSSTRSLSNPEAEVARHLVRRGVLMTTIAVGYGRW
jgi:hypothetical protein